ncbi:hypothetical protein [uncultured Parabacteroides sp.]|jgi:hypothetical protein|uniref:hypothetical protein n=2 Tax=uncultured Parabacteroides sp. TaxID=512312 RepID=UPI0025FC8DC4|nr:hypothetical protein [uncultured Parabacteroides sp.]
MGKSQKTNQARKCGFRCVAACALAGTLLFIGALSCVTSCITTKSYRAAADSARVQTMRCDSICQAFASKRPEMDLREDSLAFVEATASLKEQNVRIQYRLTQVLADMRLEFSNQLGSVNAWIALWIALLTVVGALLPIFMGFLVRDEYRKELDEVKAERENDRVLLLNSRLMNVATAIETLIYDDCSPLNSQYPLRIFDVFLTRTIELLEEFRQCMKKAERIDFMVPVFLSLVAGVKRIFRLVTVLLTEVSLYKIQARVEDMNDVLNMHINSLMEKYELQDSVFKGGQDRELVKSMEKAVDECLIIIGDLRALLRKEEQAQQLD